MPLDAQSFVSLPQFEGPLELLLFLIKKEEINIYDIPIAKITERYLHALKQYQDMNLDLGGEFLVMASTLMYIKTKMLLPRDLLIDGEEDGPDPRRRLVQQLLEFQMYQDAAEGLRGRELLGFDTFHAAVRPEQGDLLEIRAEDQPLAPIGTYELIQRFFKACMRSKEFVHHVRAEEIPLRKCVETIVERLNEKPTLYFSEVVNDRWFMREMIVMFLAVLELCKMRYLKFSQNEPCGPIRLERQAEDVQLDWSRLSWM